MKTKWILAAALGALLLASCGIGKPWPVDPASTAGAREHHVVLGVGDSLLGQSNYSLAGVLTRRGMDVTYYDAHVNGSGPLSPLIGPLDSVQYPSTLEWMKHNLDLHPDVDTVVIEYGGACSTCDLWLPPPLSYAYGSQAFYDAWIANTKAMIDEARNRGKTVIYAISPPVGNSGSTIASGSTLRTDVANVLSMVDTAVLAPYAGNPALSWWNALADVNDAYQTTLRYDDADHAVRYDDLVHVTEEGSKRASVWTAYTLDTVWLSLPRSFAAAPADGQSEVVQAGDPITVGAAAPEPSLQAPTASEFPQIRRITLAG